MADQQEGRAVTPTPDFSPEATGLSDEAEAWLRSQPATCDYLEGDGCCGCPEDEDFCGGCSLATPEAPDRNGGWPGKEAS